MSTPTAPRGPSPPDDPWRLMLVERMRPKIEARAARLAKKFKGLVLLEDLLQDGYRGLLEAANLYDEARNTTFEAYATYRIDGAMLDTIRALSLRARVKRAMLRAAARLLASYRDDFDFVQHGVPELERRLDTLCDGLLDVAGFAGAVDAVRAQQPEDDLVEWEEYRKVYSALRDAILTLDPGAQRLLVMLYVEGFYIEDAAEALGVNRSTINRRHAEAREALRRELLRRRITSPPPPRDGPPGGAAHPDDGRPPLDPTLVTDEERRRWGKVLRMGDRDEAPVGGGLEGEPRPPIEPMLVPGVRKKRAEP